VVPRFRRLHLSGQHRLSGAYALDAVTDPAEAARFERHLVGCTACTAEVRGLRAVATAMAFDVPDVAPPAGLRDRVLSELARTPQEVPSWPADPAVAGVLGAPDARILTGRSTHGGFVTAVVSAQLRALVATLAGLPMLPRGSIYELWLIGPSIRPAGLVSGADPVLAGEVAPGDTLGITVEPAGGSPQPTTTPIVLIPLFSA
jgi:hypothetical protein